MTSATALLGIAPLVVIAVLSGALAGHRAETCSADPARMKLAAQKAVKDRLPNLAFAAFAYAADDRIEASADRCDWTVIGHVEARTESAGPARLRWVVNLRVAPGGANAPTTVRSSIVF
jgi:hypothetical protein